MKVLLTGATGLIGGELGIALVRQGHEVVALVRDSAKARRSIAFPCRMIEWDFRSALDPAVWVGVQGVVHLAGEPIAKRWTPEYKLRVLESRVVSTQLLRASAAQASSENRPRVWVNASAIGFYGDRGDTELSEDASPGNDFLSEICTAWENATPPTSKDLRSVRLRIGVVLARNGGMLPQILAPFRFGAGGIVGNGKQWLSWIHLQDLVQLIGTALTDARYEGVVNAVSPSPITNKEFTRALAIVVRKPTILRVPGVALKAGLGEMAMLSLMSQRVLPTRALANGFIYKFTDIDAALADLLDFQSDAAMHEYSHAQWVPKPLEDVFAFFSDTNNLERLTPPWLSFKIVSKSSAVVKKGTLIDYRLKIHGVPVRWRSRIEDWEPDRRFADQQLSGPYRHWYHTHTFERLGSGTLMCDRVLYKIPAWPLGEAALPLIRKDLGAMFQYRFETIDKLFGAS